MAAAGDVRGAAEDLHERSWRVPHPNLIAGSYIVRAAAPPQTDKRRTAGLGYPSLFYPDALSPDAAEPITVTSGEVSQASITLRPGPAFRISGTIDSNGSDLPVCFGLVPKRYNSASRR